MSNIMRDAIRPGDTIKVTTWDQGVLVERCGIVGRVDTTFGSITGTEGGILWNGAWAGKYSFDLIDRPQQRDFKGLTQEWASEPDKEPTEAQWSMTETEFNRELETAREQGRAEARKDLDFDFRVAALQHSVAYWGDSTNRTSSKTVNVAQTFETYLRDGKRI